MKFTKSSVLVFLALTLFACHDSSSVIKLDSDKHCKPLKVKQGQEIIVTLETNPSTGYKWLIVNQPHFLTLIEPEPGDANPGRKDIIGKPDRISWHYKIQGKGEDNLRYVYQRPWEKNRDATRTFNCKIVSD